MKDVDQTILSFATSLFAPSVLSSNTSEHGSLTKYKNNHNHNAKDDDNENVTKDICNICNEMFGLYIIQQGKYFERQRNYNNQS